MITPRDFAPVLGRSAVPPVQLAAAALAAICLALAVTQAPWLAAGAVLGGILLLAIFLRPLFVIAAMLVIGPVDLSFVTGGFKSLFAGLGGLDMNGIRLIGMVAGLSLLAMVEGRVLREAFGRYAGWYLLFLIFAACTLAYSFAPLDGLRLLMKLAYPFLVFITVLGLGRSQGEIDRMMDATLIGAAVIALVLNPWFVLAGGYERDFFGNLRIKGMGAHQNPYSFYLLVMLLIALVRFFTRRQQRYLWLGLALSIWMGFTFTRITLLAAFPALLALAVFASLARRDFRPLVVATAVAALVGLVLAPSALERTFFGRMPTAGEVVGLLGSPLALYEAINWEGRQVIWSFVISYFVASPWVGVGMGSTSAVLRENIAVEVGHVVHNEYLRLLTETGVLGVVLFAAAVGAWLLGVLRMARTASARVVEFAAPAAAAILAWAVISTTDNAFDYYGSLTQYVAFLCAGALLAARFARADAAAGSASGPMAPTDRGTRGGLLQTRETT